MPESPRADPGRPQHYEWIDQSQRYNNAHHVVRFPCSCCGALLTVQLDQADDPDLVCDVCGKGTMVPRIPCVREYCLGVYQTCGGEIEAVDTSSYDSGLDTDYRCAKCGMLHNGIRHYRGDETCDAFICNSCGDLSWSTSDLPRLELSDMPLARHRDPNVSGR